MSFLSVERVNKADIYISAAREQKALGTVGVRHDGYHAVYEMLVRHVVSHSRPASISLTLVFFLCIVIVL